MSLQISPFKTFCTRIPLPLRFTLKFVAILHVMIGIWAISIRHLVPNFENWAMSQMDANKENEDTYDEARVAFSRGDVEKIGELLRATPTAVLNHPHESFWEEAIRDLPQQVAEQMVLASTPYDLNRFSAAGFNPLEIAMKEGREGLVLMMLKQGANPNRGKM